MAVDMAISAAVQSGQAREASVDPSVPEHRAPRATGNETQPPLGPEALETGLWNKEPARSAPSPEARTSGKGVLADIKV